MSHTIRVSDKVYNLILKYQAPRETSSEVIERAFVAFEVLHDAREILGPSYYLRERPKEHNKPLVIAQIKGRESDFMKPNEEVKE